MAGEIHSNVEFMNQVNQMYTYAQIPLKMSGQHASGELFVYTNKKGTGAGRKGSDCFFASGSGSSGKYGCFGSDERT